MISTFQALGVFLLALWPGAAYTFAFERQVGSFGITVADRLIRFFAASVAFQALLAGLTVIVYRDYIANGRLQHGHVNAWVVEGLAVAYVLIPILGGILVGWGHNQGKPWARLVGGEAPEPRAWDYLWRQQRTTAVVRIKLKSGTWVAGLFETYGGRKSYASGYPEPADLYLSVGVQVDPSSGAFVSQNDDTPRLVEGETGLLIRWDEIEYLDILEG